VEPTSHVSQFELSRAHTSPQHLASKFYEITYSPGAYLFQMSLLCESFSARAFEPRRFSPGAFRPALSSTNDASPL